MTKDERIVLCKELFDYMVSKSVLVLSKKGYYMLSRKERLYDLLKDNKLFRTKFSLYVKEFRELDEALYCILHQDDFSNHLCSICHKICRFDKKYRLTCSKRECYSAIYKSEEVAQKRVNTNIKRYGADNPSKSSEVREKRRKTMVEHYGNNEYFHSDEYKRRMLKKYGIDNPMKSKEVQEKSKQTSLERYGVEYPIQNLEVKNKSIGTCLRRYGAEHPAQSEEVQIKMRSTNLELYGVENPMQNEKLKTKWKNSYHTNNSVSYFPINKTDEDIIKVIEKIKEELEVDNISIKDIYSNIEYFKKFIIFIHSIKKRLLTLNEIADVFDVYPQTIKRNIDKLSLTSLFHIKDSKLELKIKDLLDSIGLKDYKRHDRTMKNDTKDGNLEMDLYLESFNLGIEINDTSSHNIKKKDPNYHYDKTQRAKNLGIRLVHIWEWELSNDVLWDRLSKWLLNILLTSKTNVNVKECTIKEVSEKEEKSFLNNFHIQGYMKSDICLGLYFNDLLIQIMSFSKPRYNRNYEYELLRLATRYGYSINGGSEILLKEFRSKYNPSSIISYCDLSKFSGETYDKLGFTLLESTKPQIIWFNENTGRHFSQTSLNMIGADKLIGSDYGKGTSNEDIVRKFGYKAMYNCGLAVYGLKFIKE